MNFITESEVEEVKKKREEEWSKARAAGRDIPLEEPEEVADRRPLYEKLKEQKDAKQEEFEEQLKFKNMIYKGLNEQDAKFLADVAEKQAVMDGRRFKNECGETAEFRTAVERVQSEKVDAVTKVTDDAAAKVKIASEYKVNNRKSQAALIASSIRRKRKSDVVSDELVIVKQRREAFEDKTIAESSKDETTEDKPSQGHATEDTDTSPKRVNEMKAPTSFSLVADYPSSSSDDES